MALLLVAGGNDDPNLAEGSIALVLDAVGWAGSDGAPLSTFDLADGARDTTGILHRIGAVRGIGLRGLAATAAGRTFARAALRSWPSAH